MKTISIQLMDSQSIIDTAKLELTLAGCITVIMVALALKGKTFCFK